jgi:DNA mismatch repair protein MutL
VPIIILDDSIASKIAAGEVIERPASVVKELVENALDAGARRVEVEVREGGRGLIRVTDDGAGMSREDAVLALQRHATSKIRVAEDLFGITTLGFRGEALPSIASVSHAEMTTREPEAEAATGLVAVGGEVVSLEETGAPAGTRIAVTRLFYNTPARLKFLRRDATEIGQIVETCTRFVFSHPGVAFDLRVDGREVLRHAGTASLRDAVVAVWGRELAEAMVPVEASREGLRVHGLVSVPAVSRASRNRQLLFVNRRWVRNRMITHALEEAYRGVLPERRFAAAVVHIEIDPNAVDVNVHPTKAEVRLSREPEIHSLVHQAVREALAGAGGPQMDLSPATSNETSLGSGESKRPALDRIAQSRLDGGWPGLAAAPSVLSSDFQSAAAGPLDLRPLAQLRETYILAESRAGLLLVDQHRAQERVLYERFAESRLSQQAHSQALLSPASVQLDSREAAALADQMEDLGAVGFQLEPFGRDAFLVRTVPAEFTGKDVDGLLHDLADELLATGTGATVTRRREQLLITLCCRAAVKAGDPLSHEEMSELLRALSGTARPYTCPHGWPVVITISNFEIDRKFNR